MSELQPTSTSAAPALASSVTAGPFSPLRWQDGSLLLLDQTLLPGEEVWLNCRRPEQVADAIRRLAVRGAPAIGVAAAYGLVLGMAAADDVVPGGTAAPSSAVGAAAGGTTAGGAAADGAAADGAAAGGAAAGGV